MIAEVVEMTTQDARTSGQYDVVVVGGGAAGLSGALALARSKRSVLVVDAGQPRNASSPHAHNYLSRDGVAPGELLALGRAEVLGYGAEVRTGRARSAARTDDGGFTVELEDGTAVGARRLLVATGLTDELPDVAGVRERWGRDVLHCPYCHGYEVRDQEVGILATSAFALHGARLWRQLTDRVTLLHHTAPELTADEREELDARGVTVVEGVVE
ncbi:MAG: Thioredoxin reductase, partial [uncultured Quadrisphaera sp.]